MKPKKTVMKCVEGLWVMVHKDNHMQPEYLGSASNPKRRLVCFVRHKGEVHVQDLLLHQKEDIDAVEHPIPANVIVEGTGNKCLDNRTLYEILRKEDVVYGPDLQLLPETIPLSEE